MNKTNKTYLTTTEIEWVLFVEVYINANFQDSVSVIIAASDEVVSTFLFNDKTLIQKTIHINLLHTSNTVFEWSAQIGHLWDCSQTIIKCYSSPAQSTRT